MWVNVLENNLVEELMLFLEHKIFCSIYVENDGPKNYKRLKETRERVEGVGVDLLPLRFFKGEKKNG